MRTDKKENFTLSNMRKIPQKIQKIQLWKLNGNNRLQLMREFIDPSFGDFFAEYRKIKDVGNMRRIWVSGSGQNKKVYKNADLAKEIREEMWIPVEVCFVDENGNEYHIEDFKGVETNAPIVTLKPDIFNKYDEIELVADYGNTVRRKLPINLIYMRKDKEHGFYVSMSLSYKLHPNETYENLSISEISNILKEAIDWLSDSKYDVWSLRGYCKGTYTTIVSSKDEMVNMLHAYRTKPYKTITRKTNHHNNISSKKYQLTSSKSILKINNNTIPKLNVRKMF